jgi:hypothetical protein
MHSPDWSLEKGLLAAIIKTELIRSSYFSKYRKNYQSAMDLVNVLHSLKVIDAQTILDEFSS